MEIPRRKECMISHMPNFTRALPVRRTLLLLFGLFKLVGF